MNPESPIDLTPVAEKLEGPRFPKKYDLRQRRIINYLDGDED
jgi:hypothetical protein